MHLTLVIMLQDQCVQDKGAPQARLKSHLETASEPAKQTRVLNSSTFRNVHIPQKPEAKGAETWRLLSHVILAEIPSRRVSSPQLPDAVALAHPQ